MCELSNVISFLELIHIFNILVFSKYLDIVYIERNCLKNENFYRRFFDHNPVRAVPPMRSRNYSIDRVGSWSRHAPYSALSS